MWGGLNNIKSPCKDNLSFHAFGKKKKKKVLVRVCELVTCEIATVVMKGRKDESQDFFFFLHQISCTRHSFR